MKRLSEIYPEYLWNQNKGYPTKKHKNAISEFGITKYHRKSFKLT
jgi:ribonuclease HII